MVIKASVGTYSLPSWASILYQHGNYQQNSVGCVGISRIPSRLTLSVPTAVLTELCQSVRLSSAQSDIPFSWKNTNKKRGTSSFYPVSGRRYFLPNLTCWTWYSRNQWKYQPIQKTNLLRSMSRRFSRNLLKSLPQRYGQILLVQVLV